jgi:hypothetical protein
VSWCWHRHSGESIELTELDAGQSLSLGIYPYGSPQEVRSDGELEFRNSAGEAVMCGPMTCSSSWVIDVPRWPA